MTNVEWNDELENLYRSIENEIEDEITRCRSNRKCYQWYNRTEEGRRSLTREIWTQNKKRAHDPKAINQIRKRFGGAFAKMSEQVQIFEQIHMSEQVQILTGLDKHIHYIRCVSLWTCPHCTIKCTVAVSKSGTVVETVCEGLKGDSLGYERPIGCGRSFFVYWDERYPLAQ